MEKKSVSYVLIESTVRRTLREIKDSPERSCRKVVDMALNFSEGRFQKAFFQTAQRMLDNEQSAYYPLIQDVAANVDHERILTFGMNLGYNGCTAGARRIREIERTQNFNIPWSLFLSIDGALLANRMDAYASLIEQGEALGIYTWYVSAPGSMQALFPLMARYADCAFVPVCAADEVDEAFMRGMESTRNVFPVIRLEERTAEVCAALRARQMPYAVCISYSGENARDILSDNLISDAESLHSAFTVFVPRRDCPDEIRQLVYDYVTRTRMGQRFRTIAWELFQDSLYVDRMISQDCCSAGYAEDGTFYVFTEGARRTPYNLFGNTLEESLRATLPKEGTAKNG